MTLVQLHIHLLHTHTYTHYYCPKCYDSWHHEILFYRDSIETIFLKVKKGNDSVRRPIVNEDRSISCIIKRTPSFSSHYKCNVFSKVRFSVGASHIAVLSPTDLQTARRLHYGTTCDSLITKPIRSLASNIEMKFRFNLYVYKNSPSW